MSRSLLSGFDPDRRSGSAIPPGRPFGEEGAAVLRGPTGEQPELPHEAWHVVQQRQGRAVTPQA